jgi:antitoxin component of MazEF toxin-antitoxin module
MWASGRALAAKAQELAKTASAVKHLLNDVQNMLYTCITSWMLGHRWRERTMKVEIKKIGNSDGLLLPREIMQRLYLKRGQQLHITELPGGGFQALPYDPDFERTMEIADEIMDRYKDTLAALAK